MGKGHRQRPIGNEDRWDSEYQRIFGDENERKTKRLHRESNRVQGSLPPEGCATIYTGESASPPKEERDKGGA